jgi:uncharacterized protein
MIHPNTKLKYINSEVGYGVFATRDMPAGTLIYVRDQLELTISQSEFLDLKKALQDQVEKFSYIDENGDRIVSWDMGKYVNHNCDSNTISTGYGFEIATRDIKEGEEITDEYGIFNLEYEMSCQCGAANCRSKISPNDFETYFESWDERIRQVIFEMFNVDQALAPYLDDNNLKELKELMNLPLNYKSVYSQRYLETASLRIKTN